MNYKFEETLFQYAACTLEGIKVGSIFSCLKKDYPNIYQVISHYKRLLASVGINLEILKDNDKYLLIYLYNQNELNKLWCQQECQQFLKKCGYCNCIYKNIALLKNKLKENEFPHDIGVFLGYSIEDIISFIEKKGQDYQCIGYWKVYNNEKEKKELFSSYDNCTNYYLEQFYNGTNLSQLIA